MIAAGLQETPLGRLPGWFGGLGSRSEAEDFLIGKMPAALNDWEL